MKEIEVKIRLADPQAARQWLAANGWKAQPVNHQINWVFDDADNTLRATARLLRIRQINEKAWLTVKSPVPDAPAKHKVRNEFEVEISDARTTVAALEALGYRIAWRYDQHRETFRQPDAPGEILLDEVSIGTFLELEGPPAWIDETASALGYSPSDYLTDSYGDLWLAYKAEHPDAGRDMVFPDSV